MLRQSSRSASGRLTPQLLYGLEFNATGIEHFGAHDQRGLPVGRGALDLGPAAVNKKFNASDIGAVA